MKCAKLYKLRITRNCYIIRADSEECDWMMWQSVPFPKKKYKKGTILTDVRLFGNKSDDGLSHVSLQFTDEDGKNYTTYMFPTDCYEVLEEKPDAYSH